MEEYSLIALICIVSLVLGKILNLLVKKFLPNIDDKAISFKYFAIEITTVCVTLLLYIKLNLSIEFFIVLVLFYTLIILSFIDLKIHAVPDYLLLFALILPFLIPSQNILEQLKSAFMLSGAIVLLGFLLNFYIQNIKSKILKDDKLKEQTALGEGDIPIIAIIGATLGWQDAMYTIFLASFFAIIPSLYNKFVKKELETPFIPFLSLALFVEYIFSVSKVFS